MPFVRTNGLEIAYESTGSGPPLLLIMGVGCQLIYWPADFCALLAERGFRVIRFDHRDTGLSTKLDDRAPVQLRSQLLRWFVGLDVVAPYTLIDMADDVAGLLDALEVDSAHVVGLSMGGMIGQTLAIRHPARLRSLTSWSSHTGDRRWFFGGPRAMGALLQRPARNRSEAMQRAADFFGAVRSPGYAFDEPLVRERAAQAYDRCFFPRGFARHVAAIFATGSRRQALRFVAVPTLVIHGLADPLIFPAAGRATAHAIPGAELRLLPGLGHDLPEEAWPLLTDIICDHARAHER